MAGAVVATCRATSAAALGTPDFTALADEDFFPDEDLLVGMPGTVVTEGLLGNWLR